MYQTVTFSMFVDAFQRMDRYTQFCAFYDDGEPVGAYDGLRVIYDYLEELDIELDVIAICCEFSHDTASEIADQWGIPPQPDYMSDQEFQDSIEECLRERGMYVGSTDYGFVYFQN